MRIASIRVERGRGITKRESLGTRFPMIRQCRGADLILSAGALEHRIYEF